jgi:hypothetical protein
MQGQERTKIGLGDPDDSTDTVHNQVAGLDPAADGTAGDMETFCDLGDREEPNFVIAIAASHFYARAPPA